MSHRVQQILNAAAAALSANASLGAIVEVNRVRSLSEEQAELPVVTVNYGADAPDDGDLDSFRSTIEVHLTAVCTGESETEVLSRLLDIRTQCHIALMADMSLGLSFVWHTAYGGADAPFLQQAERMLGSLTARWGVRYIMNISDPS
jgi:hypothetical protein